MKRPLLAAALCVVLITAMRLEMGGMEKIRPDCISMRTLEAYTTLLVTGQVYQKDEQSVYLKSVILSAPNAIGQSAGSSWQEDIPQESISQGNLSRESISQGNLSQGIISRESTSQGNLSQEVISWGNISGKLTKESTLLNASEIHMAENLICETDAAAELPMGSWVAVRGEFLPFSSATNPGEFDAAVYYRTLGIGGKLRKTSILSTGEGEWPVREWLYQLKCLCRKRLYAVFPDQEAAIMSALLLGDKNALDNEVKEMYQRNGILHIFSISSLHITIVGMGIYKLLRKAGIPILPASMAGSLLLILYGCMTGFGVSACRAIGMYLLRMLAEVVGRTYDLLTALGVMAAVMVIQNPYYLQNGGFLLSFTSVMGIGVVFPALKPERAWEIENQRQERRENLPLRPGVMSKCKILRKNHKQTSKRNRKSWVEQFHDAAFAGLSITLTTLPVQLWLYYEIPTYSVLLNLFVIPFLKPMMISGIMTLLPGLGWLSCMNHIILKGYEFFCHFCENLPFHTWNPGCPKPWQIAVYYMLLLAVAVCRYYQKAIRRNRDRGWYRDKEKSKDKIGCEAMTFISTLVLCAAVLLMGIGPARTDCVTFLDVGQGDCILVRTASGQTYLFDCGSSSRSSVGKYVLIPYLKYCGIHVIDAVFLSHPDADHVNGALELLSSGTEEGIAVRQLLLPAIEKEAREEQFGELLQTAERANAQGSDIMVGYLAAGDTWNCGSAAFTCLHPGAEYSSSEANAYSECFYVEFPQWTLLLTGDVEGRGEAALLDELAARKIQQITVLKAAHHGSRNASSEALLCQISPRLTVISCGRNNRYGHPHQELLERLEQTDTYIMQTAQSGAVTITCERGNLRVSYCSAVK